MSGLHIYGEGDPLRMKQDFSDTVAEITKRITRAVDDGGAREVIAHLEANGYLAEHDRQVAAKALREAANRDDGSMTERQENTHYGIVVFSGDPASEHPDAELRGQSPSITLIACGPEQFCWDRLVSWADSHPLRMWEDVEVVTRHSSVVRRSHADISEQEEA